MLPRKDPSGPAQSVRHGMLSDVTGQARIVGTLVIAAVSATILLFAPWTADVFNLTKLTAAAVLILLATALAFSSGRWVIAPPPRQLVVPVTALVLTIALATALAERPVLSVIGTYGRFGGLLSTLLWASIALLAAAVVRTDAQWAAQLARGVCVAAVIVSAYALLQRAGIDAFDFRDSAGGKPDYPGSTVGNSLFAGSVLGIAAPLVVAQWLQSGTRARVLYAGAAAVLAAGLWATSSRSGVVGAVVGTAIVLFRERRPSARAVAVVAALAIVGGAVVALSPMRDSEVFRTESLRLRAREWRVAAAVVADHPVVGTGPDTFGFQYPRYRRASEASAEGFAITDRAHNLMLDYAVAAGVLGVVAFAAVALLGLRGAGSADSVGAVGGWAAYLVAGQFSFDVPATAAVGFALLGVIVGLRAPPWSDRATRRERAAPLPRQPPRRGFIDRNPVGTWAALAAALTASLWLVVQPWRADVHAGSSGRRPETLQGFARAAGDLDRAAHINPREAAYRVAAAQVALSRTAELGEKLALVTARRHLDEALGLQPDSVVTIVLAAEVEQRYATGYDPAARTRAIRLWERSVVLDPNHWMTHERLGRALTSFGQDAARGERELRRARVLRSAR